MQRTVVIGVIESHSESPFKAEFFKSQHSVGIHTKSPENPITTVRCVLQIASSRGDSRKRAKKCAHGRVQKGGVQAKRKKYRSITWGKAEPPSPSRSPLFGTVIIPWGKRGQRTTASRKTVETTRIPLDTAAFFSEEKQLPSRYEGRKPGENPVCPVFSSPTPGVPSLRPRRTAELRLAADAQAHHPPLPAAGLVGRRHHRTPCFTWRGSGARKRSTARRIKRAPPPPGRT